jgi:hypothetical protein
VEQAHFIKGLNEMHVKCRCFVRLRINPRCITDLAAVSSPELGIRSGRIACTLSGAVEQEHTMTSTRSVSHVKLVFPPFGDHA